MNLECSNLDIIEFTKGLNRDELGIWRGADQATVSYPDDGHGACLEVEDRSFWFRHRNRCILDAVRRFPPRDRTLLEIGGGNGAVAAALLQAGFNVALLEPGPIGARNAKARGIPTVIQATFEEAEFDTGCLPAAGLFDVIEHVEDDEVFLRSIYRALIPGGNLYVTVPSSNVLWSEEDIHAGHFRRYSRSSISEVLERAGYKIESFTYLFRPLVIPMFCFRALPFRLGLSRSEQRDDNVARDHGTEGGLLPTLVESALQREWRRLKDGCAIPFGTSCLLVAQRPG